MKRTKLDNVTLLAVSSVNIKATLKALLHSMKKIDFARVLFLTDAEPRQNISPKIHFVKIPKIDNINAFNNFMVYDLHKYIDTDFILQIHYDGFVVHPELWSNDFLQFDYLGSPWPEDKCFVCPDGQMSRVGNSVGIRSKRLLELPSKLGLKMTPGIDGTYNEDVFLCVTSRRILEENGCKFAPLQIAARFGKELSLPENKGKKTFLFHKWFGENWLYPDFRYNFIYLTYLRARRVASRIIKGCSNG